MTGTPAGSDPSVVMRKASGRVGSVLMRTVIVGRFMFPPDKDYSDRALVGSTRRHEVPNSGPTVERATFRPWANRLTATRAIERLLV
jgi:hypothetical protein